MIVAEGLLALVAKAVDIDSFSGFKVGDNLLYSIVQLADDTILLGQATWDNLWSIKTILRSFELVSGLKVNFHKSKLIGINVSEVFLGYASTFLHCRTETTPFKFLGIPVGVNPRCGSTWRPVIDLLHNRLASWKGRNLSIGGQVALIKSVLNSTPLYFFSFYKAPKVVLNSIIKIQRDFCGASKKMVGACIEWRG